MIRRNNLRNSLRNRKFESDFNLDYSIEEIDDVDQQNYVIHEFVNFIKQLVNNCNRLKQTYTDLELLRLFSNYGRKIFKSSRVRDLVESLGGEVFEPSSGHPGDRLFIIPLEVDSELIEENFEKLWPRDRESSERICIPTLRRYKGAMPYVLMENYKSDGYDLIVNFFFDLDFEAE